jgi:hypothetical protein
VKSVHPRARGADECVNKITISMSFLGFAASRFRTGQTLHEIIRPAYYHIISEISRPPGDRPIPEKTLSVRQGGNGYGFRRRRKFFKQKGKL